MLARKTMAKEGKFLDAFLFNSPFLSIPIKTEIKNKKVKHELRFESTGVKAGLAFAVGIKSVETSEPLHLLPSANLTVNQSHSEHFRDHDLGQ
ncbi:hypothetical protein PTKIN_Ptkin01aG0344200 [Pterospermum kingtungense]